MFINLSPSIHKKIPVINPMGNGAPCTDQLSLTPIKGTIFCDVYKSRNLNKTTIFCDIYKYITPTKGKISCDVYKYIANKTDQWRRR